MHLMPTAWIVMVAAAGPAVAWEPAERGAWVALQVEVAGKPAPLYAGTGDQCRYYVEARQGRDYVLRVSNRTAERVAVELTVDGLNVISGERDTARPDRMYVLGPWESTEVRGWRTSLEQVRRFTFVDEQASYAARSDKANGKMGWIEMAVYRERHHVRRQKEEEERRARVQREELGRRRHEGAGPLRGNGASPAEEVGAAAEPAAPAAQDTKSAAPSESAGRQKSYPGTGWGAAVEDHVRLVDFEAESSPVERLTVRYEYRDALYALGVLPGRGRARLDQRERGEYGFAQPPRR